MSFFDDEEDLHDEGLCGPEYCRFCEMEDSVSEYDDEDEDDAA